MRPTAQRRLLGAVISYLMGIATRIAVQLATLPILFASWPTGRVGTWLMLFALPSYLAVAGQAFSGAGGNVALAAAREGRWDDARSAFRASWVWTSGLVVVALALLQLVAAALPEASARQIGFLDGAELRASMAWLGVYILALSQSALMIVPLRVSERYPQFNTAQNIASLCEIGVLAACVAISSSYVLLAASFAVLRIVSALVLFTLAWRLTPEMFRKATAPLAPSLRELVRPSLAFMILPVVYVLNLQGYTLLVGFAFGAQVVAGFVAIRVVVRAIDLVTSMLFALQFHEAGYIDGDKQALQRRQLATMTSLSVLALGGFAVAILFAGEWLFTIFTAGKSSFDLPVAMALLCAGALRALATTPQSIVAAENALGRISRDYLVVSVLALGVALALAMAGLPLLPVAAMLVPAELYAAIISFRAALRHLDWRAEAFAIALVSRQRFADVVQLARFLGHRG